MCFRFNLFAIFLACESSSKMIQSGDSKMITDYLTTFGKASRQEIDKLLWGKLSDALDDEQKTNKIANLLTNLRRGGHIRNTGSRKIPIWKRAE